MNIRLFPALALALCATVSLRAAALTRDLGDGLVYERIHSLPGDLPTGEDTRKLACVLDLRYVKGDAAAASALDAWLRFHAGAHTPVFILANADTSSALLAVHTAIANTLVIGAPASGFAPDIAVHTSAATERRAYDALEKGTAVQALITDNPDKPRNDEAALAKERAAGADSAPLDDVPDIGLENAPAPKPKTPPPLLDESLQRARQLHRALLALKKI